MRFSATPLTAALAGIFSAIAWPLLSPLLNDTSPASSAWFVAGTLLVLALPAHAFVVGFHRSHMIDSRAVDTALLKRIAAWLLAAAMTVGVTALYRSL